MISVLGVDVGGTKIAVGPVDRAGTQLAPPLVEPSRKDDTESFLAGLEATLRRALAEFDRFSPGAVGLACAGTIDSSSGTVVTSPNLPLTDVPLGRLLGEALKVPVVLENDANAALVGEAKVGAAVGLRHVLMLVLGTGLGGGLLLDGRLYRGAGGAAGEFGHMVVRRDGLPCPCGLRGCLERYASGPALARYAAAMVGDPERDPEGVLLSLQKRGRLTGQAVTRLAREGHSGAGEAVRQLAEWLAVGLVNLTNALNPEMIVVGGGVADLGELLLRPAREYLQQKALAPGRDQVKVVSAKLGNTAGLVGAALVAWAYLEGADAASASESHATTAGPGGAA